MRSAAARLADVLKDTAVGFRGVRIAEDEIAEEVNAILVKSGWRLERMR